MKEMLKEIGVPLLIAGALFAVLFFMFPAGRDNGWNGDDGKVSAEVTVITVD